MENFKCRLGLHKWEYHTQFHIVLLQLRKDDLIMGGGRMSGITLETRKCTRCKMEQFQRMPKINGWKTQPIPEPETLLLLEPVTGLM